MKYQMFKKDAVPVETQRAASLRETKSASLRETKSASLRRQKFKWEILMIVGLLIAVALSAGTRSYTDNGDGTVKDNVTGLVWQKCTRGQNNDAACTGTATDVAWQTAMKYCKDLSLASKTWRLPSVNELKSLADRSRYNPTINTSYFPATVSSYYWSSSTHVDGASLAWSVFFSYGDVGYNGKTGSYYVRCVSGP